MEKERDKLTDTVSNDFSSNLRKEAFTAVKYNLENVLHSFKFCAVCLAKGDNSFYQMKIGKFDNRRLNLEEDGSVEGMMLALFSDEVLDNLCNNYICGSCRENLRQAYMFTRQVKNYSQIVNCYLEQINKCIDGVETVLNSSQDNNYTNTVIVLRDSIDEENNVDLEDIGVDCGESFHSKGDNEIKRNKQPIRRRTSKKYDECPDCTTSPCVHEKYLKEIQKQRSLGKKFFNCLDCEYIGRNKIYLIGHVNIEHLNLLPHLCEHCGQSFATKSLHSSHLKINHREYIRCQYCDKEFKDKSKIYDHESICQNVRRQHSCGHCKVSLDTKEELDLHVKRHTHCFPCKLCSRSFLRESSLKRHSINTHHIGNYQKRKPKPAVRQRNCSICPEKFTKWIKLKEHMSKHKSDERHWCDVCKKTFATWSIYQAHCRSWVHVRRVNPSKEFNFKCKDCEFTCASANLLENHKNLYHLNIRPYVCEMCPKAFTTSTHLKQHIERHEGLKKFKCKECDLSLVTKSALKKHFLRYHAAERPYPCDNCERTFVNLSERDIHTKRFHSKKTFTCPVCAGMFHTLPNVRNHIKNVHAKNMNLEDYLKDYEQDAKMMEVFRDRRKPFVETINN